MLWRKKFKAPTRLRPFRSAVGERMRRCNRPEYQGCQQSDGYVTVELSTHWVTVGKKNHIRETCTADALTDEWICCQCHLTYVRWKLAFIQLRLAYREMSQRQIINPNHGRLRTFRLSSNSRSKVTTSQAVTCRMVISGKRCKMDWQAWLLQITDKKSYTHPYWLTTMFMTEWPFNGHRPTNQRFSDSMFKLDKYLSCRRETALQGGSVLGVVADGVGHDSRPTLHQTSVPEN